jgi:hypothetical protein
MKLLLSTLLVLIISSLLEAKNLRKEKFYQKIFCSKFNGILEYRLKDKSKVDCLTKTYAIEVDFSKKWAESIGQSLYYSLETNTRPGVLLITEKKQKDIKYLKRLKRVAKELDITIWTIDKNLVIKRIKVK